RTLIAVAAAFHHQTQIILTGEVDRCRNVVRIPRCDGEHARFREPRVDPSEGLGEARLLADIVWILDVRDQALAASTTDILDARLDRKFHRNQVSVNSVIEPFPRRFGGPVCIFWTPPAKSLAGKQRTRPKRPQRSQTRSP